MKIYECPICHRKFSENEIIDYIWVNDVGLFECTEKCPNCKSSIIKSDNGEYIEYED